MTSPSLARRYGLTVAVAVAVLVVDQLTKWWALENLTSRTIDLVWTLRLRLAFNRGAAFSIGADNEFARFIPFAALIVVAIVIWQGRTIGSRLGSVALGLILGGAVGNLIDRGFRAGSGGFFTGAVVDFIDFQWFPIFNVADSGVVVGGILLVLVSLRDPVPPDDEVAGVGPPTADALDGTIAPDPSGRTDPDPDVEPR